MKRNSQYNRIDQKLSDRVTDYWTQFAHTGDPNHEGASQWPAYETQQRRYLNLAEKPEVRSRLKKRECDIIDAAFPATWQPTTNSALDKRIALSAPDIPFVVDSMKGFKMTSWPGMIILDWLGRDPAKNTWELASTTYSYVDSKNLAAWVECPLFMGVGLQDKAAPAPTAFAAYNQVRGPKEYRIYLEAGHRTPPEHTVAKMAWIRKRFAAIE